MQKANTLYVTRDLKNALATKTYTTKNGPTEGEIEQLSLPKTIYGPSRRL